MTGDDREIKTKSRQQEKQAVLSFGKKKKKIVKFFFLLLTVLFLFWNKVELKPSLGKVVIRDSYSSTLSEDRK